VSRLSGTALYAVRGEEGPWRYVGQATYVDDAGRTVEHDYVRMVQDDSEVWVAPDDVTERPVVSMPLHLADGAA
jgi:hypothetical protein